MINLYDKFEADKKTRGQNLDQSYHNVSEEMLEGEENIQEMIFTILAYYPHPYDRAFVIDNSPSERRLQIIQRKIEDIYQMKSNDSWANISASTPKPKSANKPVINMIFLLQTMN